MNSDLIAEKYDGAAGGDMFDLDLEVSVEATSVSPAVSSNFLCTPGCTSPGGGSFCSYCC
ncbi:gallidermin family lantibiotic [Nocardiopsis sp. CNT-189]|uniref:gallidermin family lantibiotic n=1 Tax=Nocardiopsis oceanisediminis TaxID=2816862 RepID=UPI003B39A862